MWSGLVSVSSRLGMGNGSPRLSGPGELDTFCNHKTLLYVLCSLYVHTLVNLVKVTVDSLSRVQGVLVSFRAERVEV